MIRRLTLATALAACALAAHAQSADTQKTALAQKIVAIWKPETAVMTMVQRPAVDAINQSRIALQRYVNAEKQAAAMKDIQTDVQTFVDQVTPVALASAQKADQEVVVPLLVKEFSTEELQQLLSLLQSPVKAKFEKFMPGAEKALGERVTTEAGPVINPKLKTLTEAVGTKLRAAAGQ